MTSPQVIQKISDQQGIILTLWGCCTRPFLSSANSLWASFLLLQLYWKQMHSLPPCSSSTFAFPCILTYLAIYLCITSSLEEAPHFLFSLGRSSLTLLGILPLSSITRVGHSMDMEIFVGNDCLKQINPCKLLNKLLFLQSNRYHDIYFSFWAPIQQPGVKAIKSLKIFHLQF